MESISLTDTVVVIQSLTIRDEEQTEIKKKQEKQEKISFSLSCSLTHFLKILLQFPFSCSFLTGGYKLVCATMC